MANPHRRKLYEFSINQYTLIIYRGIITSELRTSDSERKRYEQLLLLEKAAEISKLVQHPTLHIVNSDNFTLMKYVADFLYFNQAGQLVIEESKARPLGHGSQRSYTLADRISMLKLQILLGMFHQVLVTFVHYQHPSKKKSSGFIALKTHKD